MTKRPPRNSGRGAPKSGRQPGGNQSGKPFARKPSGGQDSENRDQNARNRRGKAPRDKRVWLFGQHPVIAAIGNPNRWIQRLLATRQGLERLAEADVPHSVAVEETDGRTLETLLPEGAVHLGVDIDARLGLFGLGYQAVLGIGGRQNRFMADARLAGHRGEMRHKFGR